MSEKKNCNPSRLVIKWLSLNRFKQNLQEIMLNNWLITVQNFVRNLWKLMGVINCRIFGTENQNFQCGVWKMETWWLWLSWSISLSISRTDRYVAADFVGENQFPNSHEFFIYHLHWTPPSILTVLSTPDRGTQSATEMLPSLEKGSEGVAHGFNSPPPYYYY